MAVLKDNRSFVNDIPFSFAALWLIVEREPNRLFGHRVALRGSLATYLLLVLCAFPWVVPHNGDRKPFINILCADLTFGRLDVVLLCTWWKWRRQRTHRTDALFAPHL